MSAPRTVIIDFETFYDKDYSLRKRGMTVPEYVLDKRFLVHGMAVNYGPGKGVWVDGPQVREYLNDELKHDILVAHQSFFDFGVCYWHYKFRPAYMLDTLLMANHVLGSSRDLGGEANDLRSLSHRLGLNPKGDTDLVLLGKRELAPHERDAVIAYALNDGDLARHVLNRLLPNFSNPEFEFWLMDHTLRMYFERALKIDPEQVERAGKVVAKRQKEVLDAAGVPIAVLKSDKQFATLITDTLKAHKVKMPMKRAAKPRKDGTQPMIPALSKSDPAFIKLTEHPEPKIANLVKARLVVRSAATITARLATMKKFADLGIGIPVHLVYYGAHTGRFSGGGGFNFQNFTSPDRAQDEVEKLLATMVRDGITAGAGHVFVPTDAAQIEARILAWWAGEEQILEAFRQGKDIYADFISEVIGEPIRKPTEEDKKRDAKHAHHLGIMRFVGKEAVLGLGFSMGVDKFFDSIKKKSRDVAKMIEEGKITVDLAAEVVKGYRDKYTNIVELWYKVERAFHAARQGSTRKVGPVRFRRLGFKAVAVDLPSGRTLYYRNIRPEQYEGKAAITDTNGRRRPTRRGREWKHGAGQRLYGGLLVENIVQAMARDILAEGIHAAEATGRPVVVHIHDEVIPRVPEADGPATLEFMVRTLSTPPAWGEGMVLSAEGKITKTLAK